MLISSKKWSLGLLAFLTAGWFAGGYSLFGFSTPLPTFSIKEEKAREYMKHGLRNLHSGRPGAARESFYQALNVAPDFHLARRFLGDAYFLSGNWGAALGDWETLLKVGYENHILAGKVEALRYFMVEKPNPSEDYSLLVSMRGENHRGYRFEQPSDVYVDENNFLYVTGYASRNLVRFDPNGRPDENVRGGDERFEGPMAVTRCGNFIYVADYNADYIHRFDLDLSSLPGFGTSGSGDGQMHGPAGLACQDEQLLVADSGNRRIQRFALDGGYISKFGYSQPGSVNLLRPQGISFHDSILYVSDGDSGVIHKFDIYGNHIEVIGGGVLEKPRGIRIAGHRLYVADEKSGLFSYDLRSASWHRRETIQAVDERVTRFERPFQSFIDKNGVMYIADFGSSEVHVFLPEKLRTTNLDIMIERVDYNSFPNIGVYVSVRNRRGEYLKGLIGDNFIVTENNSKVAPVRADYLKKFDGRLSVVLAVEESAHMERFHNSYRYVLRYLLSNMYADDSIAHLSAGMETVMREGFGNSRLNLEYSLDRIEYPTLEDQAFIQTGKALYTAVETLTKRKGARAVLYFTSGRPHEGAFNQYSWRRLTQYALAAHVPIYVVSFSRPPQGMGEGNSQLIYMDNLRELAQATGGKFYHAFQDSGVKNIYADIAGHPQRRYLVSYETSLNRNLADHYVDLELEVRYKGMTGLWNSGYFVPSE